MLGTALLLVTDLMPGRRLGAESSVSPVHYSALANHCMRVEISLTPLFIF